MPLSLLHPGLFAFGLACVSIPIILHLLKRKRRPIPWGAMRFLEQAYRKRRRILTIEQLILLTLRCLLMLFIALGVGSLMLGSGLGGSAPTTMVIVLDQSIGSALVHDGVSDLQRNKALALRAMDELDELRGDQVMLITSAAPATGVVVPETTDLNAVRTIIEGIEAMDSGIDFEGAFGLAEQIGRDPERETRHVLVVATSSRGFESINQVSQSSQAIQSNQTNLGGANGAGGLSAGGLSNVFGSIIVAEPSGVDVENIGIVGATTTRSLVTSSGLSLPMGVRVDLLRSGETGSGSDGTASGTQAEQTSTIEVVDHLGNKVGQRRVRWSSGQTSLSAVVAIDSSLVEATNARTAFLGIRIDDDANELDNMRLIALPTRSSIRVGVVDRSSSQSFRPNTQSGSGESVRSISASRWVRAALAPTDGFGITIVDIDAARASSMLTPRLDAIVVVSPAALDGGAWDRIEQLNQSGTLLIVAPDAGSSSLGWIERVSSLSDGMVSVGSVLNEHASARSLIPAQSIEQTSLLAGMAGEFESLASAVSISRNLRLETATSNTQTSKLALIDDGSSLGLQSMARSDKGMIVVFSVAFDLEWSNLPARPIFVPMMQEIVRQGVGFGSSVPTIDAGDRFVRQAWTSSVQRVLLPELNRASRAESAGSIRDPEGTRASGIIAELDSQGATRAFTVINPDGRGGVSDVTDQETIEAFLEDRVGSDELVWANESMVSGNNPEDTANEQAGSARAGGLLSSESSGLSVSLWMLTIAGIIAGVEFVLARLFTVRLEHGPIRQGKGGRA
jgi:Aerotolerance regulator N-terminal/von Willebrand factor type A domain